MWILRRVISASGRKACGLGFRVSGLGSMADEVAMLKSCRQVVYACLEVAVRWVRCKGCADGVFTC